MVCILCQDIIHKNLVKGKGGRGGGRGRGGGEGGRLKGRQSVVSSRRSSSIFS